MSEPLLPIPNILGWQALYKKGARARCIKDDPPMYGFGRNLKSGDIVDVHNVCWRGKYEIAVSKECAFYELEGYFEVLFPKQDAAPMTTASPQIRALADAGATP